MISGGQQQYQPSQEDLLALAGALLGQSGDLIYDPSGRQTQFPMENIGPTSNLNWMEPEQLQLLQQYLNDPRRTVQDMIEQQRRFQGFLKLPFKT